MNESTDGVNWVYSPALPPALSPPLSDWQEDQKLSRVARWFQGREDARTQCMTSTRSAGINKTHRWLIKFFSFPYSRQALCDHAVKVGWWTPQ